MTGEKGRKGTIDGGAGKLKTRIVAALVLAPLALGLTWAGIIPFFALTAVLVAIMAHEWAAIVHGGDQGQFLLHAIAGISGSMAGLLVFPAVLIWGIIAAAWMASILLVAWRMEGFTRWHVFGVPYMALPAFALVVLRGDAQLGLVAIVFLFAVVWSADTLAYFAGRAIGGPKFAPRISPKKTWAGFFGAVSGGALAGVFVALAAGLCLPVLVVLGAFLGAVEQMGDLFESAAKRRFGVKDSGSIIPGHGGVLDRVDGLVAAAVAALLIGWLHEGLAGAARGILVW